MSAVIIPFPKKPMVPTLYLDPSLEATIMNAAFPPPWEPGAYHLQGDTLVKVDESEPPKAG